MLSTLRAAVVLLLAMTLLTGVAYPLAVTGLAQAVMPDRANGSPVTVDGRVVGSSHVGQSFTTTRYFHGRPSAAGQAGYDAAASSGSNLGPSSAALRDAIRDRVARLGGGPVPADLVMASGSGLDPHISPEAALAQVPRVAAARNVPEARLRTLVAELTEERDWRILGERRINVLALNIALDRLQP